VLAALLFGAVVLLFVSDLRTKRRRLDDRVTFRRADKIPYGTFVAFRNLVHVFPKADFFVNRSEPGFWDSLSTYDTDQVLLVIAGRFTATEKEMNEIIDFVRNGNDAFISTRYFSAAADRVLGCNTSAFDLTLFVEPDLDTGMRIRLRQPPFSGKNNYRYPGKKFNSYFTSFDTTTTEVLGYDESGYPNFVRLRVGAGRLYVHLEPLAFTNYFLLHGDNISYYEKALSMLNPGAKRVVWDEYFLYKPSYQRERKPNWLSVLFRYPGLKAALLTALFTLVLYTLLEMRRKQRIIPVIARPRNDSIDFVKTIGRLYYDKGDHRNLARKMTSYFLEHVRNRYHLSTVKLDEEFIQNLRVKTRCREEELRSIVSFIKYLEETPAISQTELTDFYKQLEAFYQTA